MDLLSDIERRAHEALDDQARAYLAGGAGAEYTLRASEKAWSRLTLRQRVMRDVSDLDTSVELLGSQLSHPILIAPTGYHALFHPDGELATARGAERAGALFVVSSFATRTIEDIARVASVGERWFQLYMQRDRGFTLELVRRVESAGCGAIVLTVDTPVIGVRDRSVRSGFALPEGMERVHLRGLEGIDAGGADRPTSSSIYSQTHDPATTWRDLEWLVREALVPVVVKGVTEPDDAVEALRSGARGIIVSNHGARNLDTMRTTVDALPRIVEVVDRRAPVLVDGGIRRGTDVVKALALGAQAVLVGRPPIWGLAASGSEGVTGVVDQLRLELEMTMALIGARSLGELDRSVLVECSAP